MSNNNNSATPAAVPGYPAQQPGYPAAVPGYHAQQPGYPAAPGYHAQQPGYPAQQPGYPAHPGYLGQPMHPRRPLTNGDCWVIAGAAGTAGVAVGVAATLFVEWLLEE